MDNTQVYDFGSRIKQLRKVNKLTQAGLAKKLGVSKETIYRYENNIQDPSLARTKQLAIILNTSLDYLMGLDNSYTIRFPNLSDKEYSTLIEFIRIFIFK